MYAMGSQKWMPAQLRDLEAMLPRLPKRPLRQVLPEITPANGVSRCRVGFFRGRAGSLLFASESAAAVRVLARNACTVLIPKGAVCCGMPAQGFGRPDLV